MTSTTLFYLHSLLINNASKRGIDHHPMAIKSGPHIYPTNRFFGVSQATETDVSDSAKDCNGLGSEPQVDRCSAKGAKCNSPGQRPGSARGCGLSAESAKGR